MIKIKTEVLKEMVSKVSKGIGNNKLIPITGFIGVWSKTNGFGLITTDGNNILQASTFIENVEDMYVTVDANTFTKLIGKLTTEFVEFELDGNSLKINADGTYRLEIPLDADGNIVKFNDIPFVGIASVIDIKKLQIDIDAAKVAVAQTAEVPQLMGYYIGDKVITTNREKVCYVNNKELDTSILIMESTADLLQLFDKETSLSINDKYLLFSSEDLILYCKQLDGIDVYPVQSIENLLQTDYKNKIRVDKNNLLNVLDRMSIFASQYSNNGIVLDITKDGFEITSQKSNAKEILSTLDIVEDEYKCAVDVEMFKSEVERVASNTVEIHYGSSNSLKIADGNVTMILSLLTE